MYTKILVRIKKCLILAIILPSQNILNKLVVGKLEDETGGLAIKEFDRLKPKKHLLLVDGSSEHKKSKLCE